MSDICIGDLVDKQSLASTFIRIFTFDSCLFDRSCIDSLIHLQNSHTRKSQTTNFTLFCRNLFAYFNLSSTSLKIKLYVYT